MDSCGLIGWWYSARVLSFDQFDGYLDPVIVKNTAKACQCPSVGEPEASTVDSTQVSK